MDSWVSSPMDAYRSWLQIRTIAGRPYAAKTVEQYGAMFAAFMRWMQAQTGRGLLDLTAADLDAFAESLTGRVPAPAVRYPAPGGGAIRTIARAVVNPEASIRTRRIYLMEIARVLDFLRGQGWRRDNPAQDLVQQIKRQTPMKFRNTALVGLPVRARYLGALNDLEAASLPWIEVRSHAMAVLMLELGLTLKEVQKLTLQDIAELDAGALRAPGHRTLRSRTLTTSDVARHWLQAWLAHRKVCVVFSARVRQRKGGGKLSRTPDNEVRAPGLARVFVSLLANRGGYDEQGRRRAVNRIDDCSIRQAANRAIKMATPDWPVGIVHGPQMLRNLCFQRWVVAYPEDEGLVAQMLGLNDTQQVRWMAKLLGLMPAQPALSQALG